MRTLFQVAEAYCVSAATPFCLEVKKLIEERNFDGILALKVNPSNYTSATHYLTDAQALAFFSKNADLECSADPAEQAWINWLSAEQKCAKTNAYLRRCEDGPHDHHTLAVSSFLRDVRKKVRNWLGPLPESLYGRFGPGVTLCCRGLKSLVPDKMSVIPTTTSSLIPYLHWWQESLWARNLEERKLCEDGRPKLNITRASEWSSVPKNALTDRSIEIGPSLNVFHQLFVGQTMKDRFLRRGWDLRHAADLHKRVACESSITGRYATIDLKQASDTVCKALVKLCLPTEWYELLDDLRTTFVMKDGRCYHLEKFSGMGNGFTFELESLLFMAISQTVLDRLGLPFTAQTDVFVFGDDIIVPTEAAQEVIYALRLCGFDINERKTFVSGPFRESCGGDFFAGRPVRPHYVEEEPNEPQQWIAFANGIRRVAKSHYGDLHRAPDLLKSWFCILDAIPSTLRRLRGPESLGDLVLNDDDPSSWVTRNRSCIRYVKVYRPVVRIGPQKESVRSKRRDAKPALYGPIVCWDMFTENTRLASSLLGFTDPRGVTPRDSVTGYKTGWVAYS